MLVAHFLNTSGQDMDKKPPAPPPELLKLLDLYSFPGNIRELRAMIFDALAQYRSGPLLGMSSIRETIEERRTSSSSVSPENDYEGEQSFRIQGRLPTLEEAENVLVQEAMRQSGGNQGIAASLLGLSRPALNRRLHRKLKHLLDS